METIDENEQGFANPATPLKPSQSDDNLVRKNAKAYKILGCTPEQVKRTKALARLGVSESDLASASLSPARHRKRKSEDFDAGDALAEASTPRKKAATTPKAEEREEEEEEEERAHMLNRLGVSEPHFDHDEDGDDGSETSKTRRFVRPRHRSQKSFKGNFKEMVERNLKSKGFHTRTRSGTVPVLSYTPGKQRRERARTESVDLEDFLRTDVGFRHMLKYLQKEYSEENLLFWKAVQDFRQLNTPNVVAAVSIYTEYVSTDAERQVNLPHWTREPLDKLYKAEWKDVVGKPEEAPVAKNVFDDAAKAILDLVRRDSLTRFKVGDAWETYIADSRD